MLKPGKLVGSADQSSEDHHDRDPDQGEADEFEAGTDRFGIDHRHRSDAARAGCKAEDEDQRGERNQNAFPIWEPPDGCKPRLAGMRDVFVEMVSHVDWVGGGWWWLFVRLGLETKQPAAAQGRAGCWELGG